MEMLNRATEDAAAFKDLLRKVQQTDPAVTLASPEVRVWNEEIERKRAEKKARKTAAKVMPHE